MTVRTALPSVPDGLQVSWVIPESACFQFTLFDVQCTSSSNTGTFRARAEALEANVSGLVPNVQYSCLVRSTLADWQRTLFINHPTISNAVQNYTYPAREFPGGLLGSLPKLNPPFFPPSLPPHSLLSHSPDSPLHTNGSTRQTSHTDHHPCSVHPSSQPRADKVRGSLS